MPPRNKNIHIGYSVNKLTVLEEGKSTRAGKYWVCICECGKTLEVTSSCLNPGNKRVIKTCGCERYLSMTTGTKNISGTYFNKIEGEASRRGKDFSITIDYLQKLWEKQDGKCYLSGVPIFTVTGKRYHRQTASLDRIDSSIGYVEGNVQWVHKLVNIMKHTMSDLDFIDWCETIVNYHKSTGFLEDR
jgi:hypothetical protein